MADPKHYFPTSAPAQTDTAPRTGRRRLSRVVHDHKGNAIVEWYDAPADYERPVLEIEDAKTPNTPHERALSTGSLGMQGKGAHEPYGRIPEPDRKRGSTTRTDLRKLSAWIKMMRSLEEAKNRRDGGDDED
jgi:hypothetical protein